MPSIPLRLLHYPVESPSSLSLPSLTHTLLDLDKDDERSAEHIWESSGASIHPLPFAHTTTSFRLTTLTTSTLGHGQKLSRLHRRHHYHQGAIYPTDPTGATP